MSTSHRSKHHHRCPRAEFVYHAPAARLVSVAGDFNQWDTQAAPMHKGTGGDWRLSVDLAPGVHEYRFFADGVWTDDPKAQQKRANAMGAENCLLIVEASAAPAAE
ncbi:MAG: isoamylase early set domain-containing protein [Lentisphaerae bacterium]|nr:isoamylase early set domain-containing protein [Lentisphaerota bacterium]